MGDWYGLKYSICYFFNVYGPKTETWDNEWQTVINIFRDQKKAGKNLTITGNGTQKRDFTHIDDIVTGCYLAWKRGRQSEYMLGTKKQYSIIEVAKMFKTKIRYIPSRKGERFKSSIVNNNAYKHLGYSASIDIPNYIENFISKK